MEQRLPTLGDIHTVAQALRRLCVPEVTIRTLVAVETVFGPLVMDLVLRDPAGRSVGLVLVHGRSTMHHEWHRVALVGGGVVEAAYHLGNQALAWSDPLIALVVACYEPAWIDHTSVAACEAAAGLSVLVQHQLGVCRARWDDPAGIIGVTSEAWVGLDGCRVTDTTAYWTRLWAYCRLLVQETPQLHCSLVMSLWTRGYRQRELPAWHRKEAHDPPPTDG